MGQHVKVILLEALTGWGKLGDEIRVRAGFARNFLLPRKKALRATVANRKHFESQRAHIEAENQKRKDHAAEIAKQLNGTSYIIIRQAGEGGQLYGSVSARDIADAIAAKGGSIRKEHVVIQTPIKMLGQHAVPLHLHTDVDISVTAIVARSPEEAERFARGEELVREAAISADDLGLELGAAIPDDEV